MGQVTPFGQAHTHDGVARFGKGHQHRLVGLRTRIRLHVGRVSAEQCLQTINRDLLNHVNMLATTVVALARITFGVLVGQLRTLCLHHGIGNVVFRGDQFDMIFLAAVFRLNDLPEFGINLLQGVAG